VTIAAGETSATVTVLVEGDVLLEDDETFTVRLSNPVEAILVDDEGLGTILDDEVCPGPNLLANPSNELRPVDGRLPFWTPLPDTAWHRRLAPPDPVDGEATFAPGDQDLAELWQDVDVTAYAALVDGAAGQDYQFAGFVRTFDEAPGDVAQIVVEYLDATGELVLDHFDTGQISSPGEWRRIEDVRTAPEGTRFLRVRLLATRFTAGDNDAYFDALALRSLATATLAVDDVELYEGASETSDAVFTVTLSCPIDGTVTVDFATADGTAVQVEDYHTTAGQLVFSSATTARLVPVPVVGDGVHESHELFHLDLAIASADFPVVPVDPRGNGLILNDDFCPRSPGFWKTHADVWPVADLELGAAEYDRARLEAFLDYGGPDATLHLARQLVATKLNLAVGSDPFIQPTVAQADLLLIELPPGSDPKGQDKQRVNAVKDELDAYNNPYFCEETAVTPEGTP
jgi:hypothetical protein